MGIPSSFLKNPRAIVPIDTRIQDSSPVRWPKAIVQHGKGIEKGSYRKKSSNAGSRADFLANLLSVSPVFFLHPLSQKSRKAAKSSILEPVEQ
jgi:hypothetical protein